jgi:hypothetical protein
MRNLLISLAVILASCSKSNISSSYNFDIDTTNPASIPSGTIVADMNGINTHFDSTASATILYYIENNDTEYTINIIGFEHPSTDYSSLTINLQGSLPFDTTNFYIDSAENIPTFGEKLYTSYYRTYIGGTITTYDFIGTTHYKATITHIDDSTIQGTFSGYLPPYSFTNGAFNIRTYIPSSYIR